MTDDFDTATRFLLGELTTAEVELFGGRIVSEPELHSLVAAAEDELLDQYAAGALSAAACRRIEERLRGDGRLVRRLALIQALTDHASARASAAEPESESDADPEPEPARVRPARSRSRWWWLAAPLAAAAAAALVVGARGRTRSPADLVEVTLTQPSRASAVREVALTPGAHRVRFELDVEREPGLRVEVRDPVGPVPARLIDDGVALAVELDAGELSPGLLDLWIRSGDQLVAAYQVRVVIGR